ncbi:MAG: hypothetical protein PHV68_05980 [Candidatus Gastranaerophilales bacterium]|nr:hypothetical protein [Candidatus Gastranaerophilales bacterium]
MGEGLAVQSYDNFYANMQGIANGFNNAQIQNYNSATGTSIMTPGVSAGYGGYSSGGIFGNTYGFSNEVQDILNNQYQTQNEIANSGIVSQLEQNNINPAEQKIIQDMQEIQLLTSGRTKASQDLYETAEMVKELLDKKGWISGTSGNSKVLDVLKDLDAKEIAAVELIYGQQYGSANKLRADIRESFSFREGEALDLLNKGAMVSPECAAIALYDAANPTNGGLFSANWDFNAGTDASTFKDIINNSNSEYLKEVNSVYKNLYGQGLISLVGDEFSWLSGEGKLTDKLVEAISG